MLGRAAIHWTKRQEEHHCQQYGQSSKKNFKLGITGKRG